MALKEIPIWRSCKFCGAEINRVIVVGFDSCPRCAEYCNRKCELASSGVSWHMEPCVSCAHNPYRARYQWNGERWVLKYDNREGKGGP